MHSDRLQVGHCPSSIRIAHIGAHTDGIVRLRSSTGALPRQTHARKSLAFLERSIWQKRSITKHFDRFVNVAHDHPRHERTHELLARRIRVPDERDFGPHFRRHEIARRTHAAIRIVIPVIVRFVDRLLLGGNRRFARLQPVRRFADDGKNEAAALLPDARTRADGTNRKNIHRG